MTEVHTSQRDSFACYLLTGFAVPSDEDLTLTASTDQSREYIELVVKTLLNR